jgi:hypothetical protein
MKLFMRNGEILPSEYQIQKFMFSCLLFNDLARLLYQLQLSLTIISYLNISLLIKNK